MEFGLSSKKRLSSTEKAKYKPQPGIDKRIYGCIPDSVTSTVRIKQQNMGNRTFTLKSIFHSLGSRVLG